MNEEFHLPDFLSNVIDWAEDIVIVDSCSTDRTVDIALERGIKLVQRPFTNFGDQWNFALQQLPITTPWTLKLDPDERLSDELKSEIARTLKQTTYDGFILWRRLWFMGKPLRVKAPVVRLWRTGKCKFSDVLVNEHPLIDGKIGEFAGLLEHYDSPTIEHWNEKQDRYTTMEAIMRVQGDALSAEPKLFGAALERRMFLKKAFIHVPFRYTWLWLYETLIRGALWSGGAGLHWVSKRIEVMKMIEAKAREMRRSGAILTVPKIPRGEFDPRVLDSDLQQRLK